MTNFTDFNYLWWEMNRPNVTKEEYEIALKKWVDRSLTREQQIKVLHDYAQSEYKKVLKQVEEKNDE
jgi:predicted secreted protein